MREGRFSGAITEAMFPLERYGMGQVLKIFLKMFAMGSGFPVGSTRAVWLLLELLTEDKKRHDKEQRENTKQQHFPNQSLPCSCYTSLLQKNKLQM